MVGFPAVMVFLYCNIQLRSVSFKGGLPGHSSCKLSTFTACLPTPVGWEQILTLKADLIHLMGLRRQSIKTNTYISSFPIDSVPIAKQFAFVAIVSSGGHPISSSSYWDHRIIGKMHIKCGIAGGLKKRKWRFQQYVTTENNHCRPI